MTLAIDNGGNSRQPNVINCMNVPTTKGITFMMWTSDYDVEVEHISAVIWEMCQSEKLKKIHDVKEMRNRK